MGTYKLDSILNAMNGCVNNDYKSICHAAYFLQQFAVGAGIADCGAMECFYKLSLYRKFMRAYTRYILDNPNVIKQISEDCAFNSMANGESSGIYEIYE